MKNQSDKNLLIDIFSIPVRRKTKKANTRFARLADRARAQGCVLEKVRRDGHSYELDNNKGTCASCYDLNDVETTLAEEAFGGAK